MAPKKKEAKTKKKKEELLRSLLEAGCHFGHKRDKTHPKARPFIFTFRQGVAIFDLLRTQQQLERASKFIEGLVKEGKKIVFVGTKRQAREIIREEAESCGMPYVVNRWLGGTITNWDQIKANSIDKLNQLVADWQEGRFKKRTKKEQAVIRREIARLEKLVGGLKQLKELPAALFVVDIKKEKTAIREARQRGVPVVAIVDSNADPTLVDYPICANDDAARSIQLLVSHLAKVVLAAKEAGDGQKRTAGESKKTA